MAETTTEIIVRKAKKPRAPRAPNFQMNEKLKLEELIHANIGILESAQNNAVTNKRKAELWDSIAIKVSALGVAKRSRDECSVKWGNMKREAKEVRSTEVVERRKTGGGVCQVMATDQQTRIGEIYKNCSSFAGIPGGLDSDEQDGRHYLSNESGIGSNLSPAASATSSYPPPVATATSSDPPPVATATSSDPPPVATATSSDPPPVATATSSDPPPVATATSSDPPPVARTISSDPPPVARTTSSNTPPVARTTSSDPPQETRIRPLPIRGKLNQGRRNRKATKQEQLLDLQIEYFRGKVDRHALQKELLEVRLRMLKKAEEKMDDMRAVELFQLLNEQ